MFRAASYAVVIALLGGAAAACRQVPEIAAGALLHPARRTKLPVRPNNCKEREYRSSELTLRGWACSADGPRRGSIVFLHGIADNRGSAVGTILRFTAKGFDVVAYDSRAHGASDGDVCTYGYFEKVDLRRVVDGLSPGSVVLIGTSLGAAVALQAAAEDQRISGVVAAEVFADLESVARDRAPRLMPEGMIRDAFAMAEERGRFRVGAVSPETAARSIRVPVLLIHGERDAETPPNHSRRVFNALNGPKQLLFVTGAGHNESLHKPETWSVIDGWVADVVRGKS
jgi:pimeloyl-ACP methyl ester carboxylesterase